jgi:hypothetical protein
VATARQDEESGFSPAPKTKINDINKVNEVGKPYKWKIIANISLKGYMTRPRFLFVSSFTRV